MPRARMMIACEPLPAATPAAFGRRRPCASDAAVAGAKPALRSPSQIDGGVDRHIVFIAIGILKNFSVDWPAQPCLGLSFWSISFTQSTYIATQGRLYKVHQPAKC